MNKFELLPTASEPDPTASLTRSNPPALPALTYGGGKYKPTVQRMLARLSSEEALARLNQDAYDDWSIAMIHAWSIVTDVLAFYQERITNEGYIRTASERRSVLALARALGYDWRPGLAANVELALTVAPDDQGAPQRVFVPKGSAVQSTPIEGQLPQIFETSADSEVRSEWNLLYPYVGLQASEAGDSEPLLTEITSLRVANYRNDLQKGDVILVVETAKSQPLPNPPQTGEGTVTGSVESVRAVTVPSLSRGGLGRGPSAVEPTTAVMVPTSSRGGPGSGPADVGPTSAVTVPSLSRGGLGRGPSAVEPTTAVMVPTSSRGGPGSGPADVGPTSAVTVPSLSRGGLGRGSADVEPTPPAPPPQPWILGTLTEVVADPQKPYTVIRWTIDATVGSEIKQPALFVFRQKALLFGYAQGAVYFDGEEAPPPTDGPTTPTNGNGATNGTSSMPRQGIIIRSNSAPAAGNNGTTEGSTTTTPQPISPRVANWTPRTLSLPNVDINAFIVNSKGAIFAGTKRDLYRSLDNGESWLGVSIDPVGRNVTSLTLDPNGNLVAGSSTGGIYISYDNGDNWTPISGDSVAPDVSVTKGASENSFKVDPPKILPKAPVLDLEFGKDRAGNAVLYALAGKQVFVSGQEGANGFIGKTWTVIEDPAKELPATQKRPTAEEERAVMLAAANGLLVATRLQWLGKIAAPVAQGLGATKWFGLDLWDFLRSSVGALPEGSNAVRALAVSTPGKKSTVVVGTDAGKFTLKEKTRRWLVATVIVLLVLLTQFLGNHDMASTVPVELAGSGALQALQAPAGDTLILATTDLIAQGKLHIDPPLDITTPTTYTVELHGIDSIAASLDDKQAVLSAGGSLPLSGTLLISDTTIHSVELAGITTFTATVDVETGITNTIYAITTTEAVSVDLTITATAQVTPSPGIWPAELTLTDVHVSGTLAPAPALPDDPRFPWLASIWQPVSDLLQTTFIATWNGITSFLSDLWNALPGWLQAILLPISYLIRQVIRFIDLYLIQPLLNYTAATLLEISAITLAVLALLLAWIYADRKMSNRKAVRLDGPVNALAIHPNGQIFAGTEKGVFRSLADDPNASWWTKATRLLIRRVFPDVPMEPINQGFTASESDPAPDIRSLAFTNTGALLAGTADGRIFRLSDPLGELDPNLQTPASDPNTPAPALVKWDCYDQGIVQDKKSCLKSVRTIAGTSLGQFVSGGVGTNKVEDRWFTAQVKAVPTTDNPQRRLGEIDLDTIYPNLQAGSWLLLRQSNGLTERGTPNMKYARYRVVDVQRVRSLDFVTVGEFTRALVEDDEQLTTFSRSRAEVLLQSEAITLFDNRPVAGDTLYLKGYIPDLAEGQRLIVNGKEKLALILETMEQALRSDNGLEQRTLHKGDVLKVLPAPKQFETLTPLPKCDPTVNACPWRLQMPDGFVGTVNATKAQVRWIFPSESDPIHSEGVTVRETKTFYLEDEGTLQAGLDYAYNRVTITQVTLDSELDHVYDRATVTIYGNVVAATHGKTVKDEVLGSGSGMQANERFLLKEGPLTYVGAANDQGYESEITVKVNEIEWQKEPYLYGLTRDQRAYIVRQDALDQTVITFGDGKQGARLPTGTELVSATYRIGIGPLGNVPAYTIDQPQTLPSAIRRVTNPLTASGGVGPDATEEVRTRTPLSVRVMDRIVALSDYEDFVRLYAGIGRVQLKRFGSGQALLLHFTVADADGNPIPTHSTLIANLLQSIDERRAAPTPQIQIDSYEQLYFDIAVKLLIFPDHKGRAEAIASEIRQKLSTAFSFAQRNFGQDVAESEVVALLQPISGVALVEEVTLRNSLSAQTSDEANPNERLIAEVTRIENGTIRPAQLLLLNPTAKGVLLQIATTSEPLKLLWDDEVLA